MDWSQVQNIIFSCVGIVLTGLCSWLTTKLITWLNTKIKDKKVAGYITSITEIVMSAVKQVMQTYVDSLKQEGAFTEDKQKEALEKCLTIIESQLTDELKSYITENFGDMTSYLQTQVEAMIYNLKK